MNVFIYLLPPVVVNSSTSRDGQRRLRPHSGGYGVVRDLPVTIAWAERDRILARPKAAELRRIAPEAELLVLPGCGHVPMNDEPELVARVLLDGSSRAM
ncbi:alpha/beta fold hydrolase [Amycolatopsis sp. NPDC102389]|uniref:alpha/beta fold hydrolase n=1 Tax=Amycolatopsis sp. NPDC102389 TaxID=3363941 RepID=UPI00382F45CF